MSFEELGLRAELLSAVNAQGYEQPTAIQQQAIGPILQGGDVLAGAQTGTGKTAAFALPILQLLSESRSPVAKKGRCPRALILTPTRELAQQVRASVSVYGQHLPLTSIEVFGGVGFEPQKQALHRGVDIVVATPGRLLDHLGQRTIDLSAIEILVLDEADRMLDMGFIHDIKKVMAALPAQRQNLLFSATYSKEIENLANSILYRPELIEVSRRNTATELVEQKVYHVQKNRKCDLLCQLIETERWHQVLVFARTKHGANRLSQQLNKAGITSSAIHGNKSQAARTRALADFKKSKIQTLVATDIAARGLDIDRLCCVVNYDLPNVPEDYVHRIGRTGRAGETGVAVSLVSDEEHKLLKDIRRLLKRDLKALPTPEIEFRGSSNPPTEGNKTKAEQTPNTDRPPQQKRRGRSSNSAKPSNHKRRNTQSQKQRNNQKQANV